MQLSVLVLAALGLSAQVLAQDVVTCGNNRYTHQQVDDAAEAACEHVEERTTVGRNNYPHTFRNSEGFEFDGVRGRYYNFPIMNNGRVYTGGSPGPDRIVINERCELAGQITHTGARGNQFVDCEDQISVRTQRNTTDPDSAGYSTSAPGILMTSVAGVLMVGAFL